MESWELFVLVEVLDGIADFAHIPTKGTPLGGYIIDWDSQSNECCPYCGVDGLRYDAKYCPVCLGFMQELVPDTEYILKHMFHVAGQHQMTISTPETDE